MLSKQVVGTFLVVSAAFTFALVAFIVERDPLPTSLAAEARFIVCWLVSIVFMLRYRTERSLKWFGPSKMRWRLLFRGCLTCSFVTLWWAALPSAPLGDCIAVIYCAPIVTVCLSRVMLGEKVLAVFPIQALCAVAGAMFIVEPPFLVALLNPDRDARSGGDYSFVIGALLVGAVTPIVTRQTKEASWIEVEHVTSFAAVFVLNPLSICVQQAAKGEFVLDLPDIDAYGVGLVVLAAMGSFLGVAMQTRGYQLAEPGKAGMYNYLEIPFGYVLQVIGTDSPMTLFSIIGSCLILLSCLVGALAQVQKSKQNASNAARDLTGSETRSEVEV